MKKVLVTGASGFIGRHLTNKLLQLGKEVITLCRTPIRYSNCTQVIGDIRNKGIVKQAIKGCDTVFHLAGYAHDLSTTNDDYEVYFSPNVDGTKCLLENCYNGPVKKFIYFSSVKAMGEKTSGCYDEKCVECPLTPYGKSKLKAEQIVLDFGIKNNVHSVCLRLPMVYGTGNKGNLVRMISAIDRRLFPPLPELNNYRSIVHVENVIEAAILVAENHKADGKYYIVTDNRPYTTREIYDLINKSLGKKTCSWHIPFSLLKFIGVCCDLGEFIVKKPLSFNTKALNKLTESCWYSHSKIARELGYAPQKDFLSTLPELIKWYRESK